jgi:cytochrome P450
VGGEGGERHAFGFSRDDIQQMARGLGPGESAGIVLIEHVWARDLRKVFRGALTPETIRAVEPQLAAISDAIAAAERRGTPP